MDSLAYNPTQLSNIPKNTSAMSVTKNYGNLSLKDASKLFNQYAEKQKMDKLMSLMSALKGFGGGGEQGLVQFKNYGFNPNQYQQFQSQTLTVPQYKWNIG